MKLQAGFSMEDEQFKSAMQNCPWLRKEKYLITHLVLVKENCMEREEPNTFFQWHAVPGSGLGVI